MSVCKSVLWHLLKLRKLEQSRLNGSWLGCFVFIDNVLLEALPFDFTIYKKCNFCSPFESCQILCEWFRRNLASNMGYFCFSVKQRDITSEMSVFYHVSVGITPSQDSVVSFVWPEIDYVIRRVCWFTPRLLDLTLICLDRSLEGLKAHCSFLMNLLSIKENLYYLILANKQKMVYSSRIKVFDKEIVCITWGSNGKIGIPILLIDS